MRARIAALVFAVACGRAFAEGVAPVDIPFQRFVLPNGLTLIVHEDHKAPIVAVNIWYHVGSKNERPGKTGFAHLFEHLMFNGSEHYNDDYFKVLEKIGATNLNGTTNRDRTNYFQNVPTSALDTVLWMESDRMGHLLGVIDKPRLDEQRGVVQNEKRQGENQPYGQVFNLLAENLYPKGHPYSWTTIGSMDDLNAASLDDVKEWFRTYYGAANAVIVLAGDVTPQDAKARVERFFGSIPSGPPLAREQAWIAKRSGSQRLVLQDRVPQARIYKVWNTPEYASIDNDEIGLLANVLASGKNSRLYKRLVYDDQIASDVSAFVFGGEIGGALVVTATALPGGDLAKVEAAVDEEMAKLVADGPTQAEVDRVRTERLADFIRGAERIGGFGGTSDVLAESEVYGGRPDYYKTRLQHVQAATGASLGRTAKRWLSDGVLNLEVRPFADHPLKTADVDRANRPEPGATAAPQFPAFRRAALANGLKLVVAERHAVPVVDFELIVDAGYAADAGGLAGTASLAGDMLDEGTATRSALEISESEQKLGAQVQARSDVDSTSVHLSALKANLDPSLALFADVVLNPSFPQADFERLKRQQLARIEREKVQPLPMALRVLPGLLYGNTHAYGSPLTGSGTAASVAKITRDDVTRFHATWFKPNNATLVIVGDTTLAEIEPRLEKLFAGWKRGDVPAKKLGAVPTRARAEVYLLDRPGAQQSMIIAGQLAPPKANPQEIPIEAMNANLGGKFVSRLNMNLREDKHWSYGVRSTFVDTRGPRPFFVTAPVQTDKTKESVAEVLKELKGIRTDKPLTADELKFAQSSLTLSLPGRWETSSAVSGSLADIVRFGLADDYFTRYPDRVDALTLKDVTGAAQLIEPDRLVWVIVGDRAKIEAGIRELNLGEVRLIDADGKPVAAPAAAAQP